MCGTDQVEASLGSQLSTTDRLPTFGNYFRAGRKCSPFCLLFPRLYFLLRIGQ